MKISFATVALAAILSSTAAKADQEQADALLAKVSAAYAKLGQYSVTSLDTISYPSLHKEGVVFVVKKRTKSSGRFGTGNRGALRVETLNTKGQTTGLELVRLNDGTTFWESVKGHPATQITASKRDDFTRASAGQRLFSPSPGLLALWIATRLKSLPIPQSSLSVDEIEVTRLPNGDSQIVAETLPGSDDTEREAHFELLIGKSGFLKKIEIATSDEEGLINFSSTLSAPTKFTDAALLQWPSLAPKPNPNFQIDPRAREILNRAARFYGGLDSLSLRVKATRKSGTKTTTQSGTVDWVRRGLLRFEIENSGELVIVDGTARWELSNAKTSKPTFSRRPIDAQNKTLGALKALRFQAGLGNVGGELPGLLGGKTPLVGDVDSLKSLRLRVLPPVEVAGEVCDVVEGIAQTESSGAFDPAARVQTTFTLAPDGRIVRYHTVQKAEGMEANDLSFEVVEQTPNAQIKAERFRWNKPQNAVEKPNDTVEIEL